MITDSDIFAALRRFIVRHVVPEGVEVVQTQQNRVAMPTGPNFVMMTATRRTFQSSSYREYRLADEELDISRSTAVGIQVDFYGPDSADLAQRFATLFQDDYGYAAFAGSGVVPLYCDDGTQMALTAGEKQYETRWKIDTVLQVNPAVSTPVQFASKVDVIIVEAD